ncbi:SgcJ/EcaC family oxidoreductase [Paenibacillus sp. HWE-109]|uniref:SgcJ/EcaC family oxidoreductase n=1 Tax=Paenibacillus sp. HWE-109 TaxID=1306526 RepID=UPI001EE04C9C|nr:SgcJ/EcaC family oxidoreductase [Paenibacillus sp. HWE-109]UKS25653.1 SgcJ/EcaC family oxidoreductase [Paenibacillus sp. HWE-109]
MNKRSSSTDEAAVKALYHKLIATWNERNAADMAANFAEDGEIIGFDGSQVRGRALIFEHLAPIFASHPTPPYYGKVKEVHMLTEGVAVLRAVAGMVPEEQTDIAPGLNTHQTLIAVKKESSWEILLHQNTPAQFHGRPELVEALTNELRELL